VPTPPEGENKKHSTLYIIKCFIIILLLNFNTAAIPLLGGVRGG
jgi:hypothetical protein